MTKKTTIFCHKPFGRSVGILFRNELERGLTAQNLQWLKA